MEFEKIAKIIADKMDIDVADIKPDSSFDSMQIDSLDMVEIVMDIEDAFDISIDTNENLETVQDLVEYIKSAE